MSSSHLEAVSEPKTLARQAHSLLRDAILCGQLHPGERLRSKGLQERYGLGLSPLRESLQRLSAEGLVVMDEQRGFFVAEVSLSELKDLTLARTSLESVMLPLALAQGDEDWEAGIVAAFHRLSRTALPTGPDADEAARQWEQRHRAFHESLVAGCASPWLMRLHGQLVDQTERYRMIRLQRLSQQKPAARDVHAEHRALMDAVLARDEAQAVALMREHLQATFEATARWLPPEPEGKP
jgi:DNA-binding GntR family transcriptional regulator